MIVAAALVLATAIASLAYVIGVRRQAGPGRELVVALRLLDRILAYDDAVTSLSPPLRDEVEQFVNRHYDQEKLTP